MHLYIHTTYVCTRVRIRIHTCVYMYKCTFMFIYIKYNINWVGVGEQVHSKDTGIFAHCFREVVYKVMFLILQISFLIKMKINK